MKRRSDNDEEEEAEAEVDDLVVASMHAAAAAVTWSYTPRGPMEEEEKDESNDDDDDSLNDSSEAEVDSSSSESVDDDDEEVVVDPADANDDPSREVGNDDAAGRPNYANEDGNDDDDDSIDSAEERLDDVNDYHAEVSSTRGKRNGVNNNHYSKENAASLAVYDGALRTENEIDPYHCTTEKLERLNVLGMTDGNNTDTTTDHDIRGVGGGNEELEITIDDEITKKLQIAGIVRSYIPGQRTVVVDSTIPPSFFLQSSSSSSSSNINIGQQRPFNVGSLLVVIAKQQPSQRKQSEADCDDDIVKQYIPITLNEMYDTATTSTKATTTTTTKCTIHVLGKIMEIFGPIQRPFYAIRLPDPPKVTVLQAQEGPLLNEMRKDDGSDNKVVVTIVPIDANAMEGENNDIKDHVSNPVPTGNNEVEYRDSNDTVSMNAPIIDNNTLSNTTNETKAKVQDIDEAYDPWSSNGKLSIMFKSYPNAIVYSLTNCSTVIDTHKVMQISGRGCDASNMYDEELGVNEQQYYSDDEQERVAKRGGGSSRSSLLKQAYTEDQQGGNIPMNRGGRSGGRRGGRGGGGRGRGRGGQESGGRERTHHGNGSFSSQQQQQHHHHHHHHQPHFQQQHIQYQQPSYVQQPPQQNHHWVTPAATTTITTYQYGMYRQPQLQQYQSHQYQPQQYTYQQHQQYQQGLTCYGQSQQSFSPMTYGAVPPPPPPPPPPPRIVGAQQPLPEENDTVYYDYS